MLPSQPATRSMLMAGGATDAMLRTQLASGRLVRLRSGVFVEAAQCSSDPVAQHILLAHAEQVMNPEAVISHESAALIWGLPTPNFARWHGAPISLTRPSGARHRTRDGVVYHLGPLPIQHLARDGDGYRLTTAARTAVDLSRGRPLPEALVILDGAARLACAALVSQPRRSDYGSPRLVRAARELLSDAAKACRSSGVQQVIELVEPSRESAIESLSAGHIFLAGLPTPIFQAPIRTPMGTLFPDCLWPDHGLIGEVDGAVKYTQADAYVREKQREQVLRDLGYRVVRWLGQEIMARPAIVIDRIARAIAAG